MRSSRDLAFHTALYAGYTKTPPADPPGARLLAAWHGWAGGHGSVPASCRGTELGQGRSSSPKQLRSCRRETRGRGWRRTWVPWPVPWEAEESRAPHPPGRNPLSHPPRGGAHSAPPENDTHCTDTQNLCHQLQSPPYFLNRTI